MSGFVYQVPPAVGGTVLVIDRIESQNYVTNVSGWAIKADGTAEMFNLLLRGTYSSGVSPNTRIVINDPAHGLPNTVGFYSGISTEFAPAKISSSGGTPKVYLVFDGPSVGLPIGGPTFLFRLWGTTTTSGLDAIGSEIHLNGGGATLDLDTTGISASAPLRVAGSPAVTTAKTAQKIESGAGSFTVNASGAIALPCTLGVVPVAALVSFQNSSFYGAADLGTSTSTTVNVFVRNILAAGALVAAGTVVVCRYFYTT